MRLHLKTHSSKAVIPFDHQHLLTGCIHKWLGNNKDHGEISLYSFSQLSGGTLYKEGLIFKNGSTFFFSSYNIDHIKKIISGIESDCSMFFDLAINEIIIEEDPDFSNREMFFAASPIFIKRRNEDREDHILFDHPRANEFLKETLLSKMGKVGMIDESLQIQFDTTYSRPSVKLITYKNIQNKASWCPVKISAKNETKLFAWNVGLGNSTGIGLGAIK